MSSSAAHAIGKAACAQWQGITQSIRQSRWPAQLLAWPLKLPPLPGCTAECRDAPECRRFHAGATGCFLFANTTGPARPASARPGRAGGSTWQAGSKLA